mmetsp:Transcript_36023/g.43396  ORF Transcript_36023/g.43396 Transcript_36023/m.43396 type:complete len:1051 (-) Transcript_36023:88-3240(-)
MSTYTAKSGSSSLQINQKLTHSTQGDMRRESILPSSEASKADVGDMDNFPSLIIPISDKTIQRIVAGQAISDLSSAVKELVDNAIDAGAKIIDIRLMGKMSGSAGSETIEVCDDGCGVPLKSRPYMAMRHATSKLHHFDDLYSSSSCQDLGFRGEALFCLAHISKSLVVTTRQQSENIGQKLWFRHDGTLDDSLTQRIARKVGTTVSAHDLFHSLPVRRQDFLKRIKLQRNQMVRMLQGYAIFSLGVRISLTDVIKNGMSCKSDLKMVTSASSTKLEDTISSVLGPTFLSGLTKFRSIDLTEICASSVKLKLSDQDSKLSLPTIKGSNDYKWKLEGFISKAPNDTETTQLKSSVHRMQNKTCVARELQFFSINGRPVELPKFSRTLSNAWREFNSSIAGTKRPACVMQLTLPTCMYDINLSPDKREVLLSQESYILNLLYEAVSDVWSRSQGSFTANEVSMLSFSVKNTDKSKHSLSPTTFTSKNAPKGAAKTNCHLTENPSSSSPAPVSQDPPEQRRKMRRRNAFVHNFQNISSCSAGVNDSPYLKSELPMVESIELRSATSNAKGSTVEQTQHIKKDHLLVQVPNNTEGDQHLNDKEHIEWGKVQSKFNGGELKSQACEIDQLNTLSEPDEVTPLSVGCGDKSPSIGIVSRKRMREPNDDGKPEEGSKYQPKIKTSSGAKHELLDYNTNEKVKAIKTNDLSPTTFWNSFTTDNVLKQHKQSISFMKSNCKYLQLSRKTQNGLAIKENSDNDEIGESVGLPEQDNSSSPSNSDSVSNRVRLKKDDFLSMEIIGQFNMGFILARCKNQHLWILDQHASDEQVNFERLCATTKIHEQRLIAPLPLELSPTEETCILDNMDIFEENGFRFVFNETKEPRHRISLVSLPHSGSGAAGQKAVQFTKDDVKELCSLLGAGGGDGDVSAMRGNNAVRRYAGEVVSQNESNLFSNQGYEESQSHARKTIVRLPKTVAMFASRACRSSIMIGTAMSRKEMDILVKKLNQLKQPWTCPHGRPTIRHVKNVIDDIVNDEIKSFKKVAETSLAIFSQDDVS